MTESDTVRKQNEQVRIAGSTLDAGDSAARSGD
jgi:hypothetical protein